MRRGGDQEIRRGGDEKRRCGEEEMREGVVRKIGIK